MRFNTEDEIFRIIDLFEATTLPSEEWRHAEHLIMAMHYALHNDFETALDKMRSGILKLNDFHGVVTTPERGYHETLTIFWIKTIFDYVKDNPEQGLVELANEIIERFGTNYPLKFYSKERLFSVEARFEFIEADLKQF